MFSDKKEKGTAPEPGTAQNRINEGTKIKGDITSTGFFRIDGIIEGNIKTPSRVVVGKTGVILGTLTCEDADIEGKVQGNLKITGTLSLKASAVIEGDVIIGKLAVEPGATLNASCIMQGGKNMGSPKSEDTSDSTPYDRQQRSKQSTSEKSQTGK